MDAATTSGGGVSLTRTAFVLEPDDTFRKQSVVEVREVAIYAKGHPRAGGLMDLRMGPLSRSVMCPTCGGFGCDGHYGHVELVAWVLRVMCVPHAAQLARTHCWACARPLFCVDARTAAAAAGDAGVPPDACLVDGWRGTPPPTPADAKAGWVDVTGRLAARGGARGLRALAVVSEACKARHHCPWTPAAVAARGRGEPPCGLPLPQYAKEQTIFVARTWSAAARAELGAVPQRAADACAPLTSDGLRDLVASMPWDALTVLGFRPAQSHPQWMFTRVQAVPPCRTRPPLAPLGAASKGVSLSGSGGAGVEHDQTLALQEVVRANAACAASRLAAAAAGAADGAAWARAERDARALAVAVNALVDGNLRNRVSVGGGSSGILGAPTSGAPAHLRMTTRAEITVKSTVNGKRGVIRDLLGGNRSNFSARGVIGTEAYDDVWVLYVPRAVMRTLTFPEKVTAVNLPQMRAAVRRGAGHAFGARTVIKRALRASGGGSGDDGDGQNRRRGVASAVNGHADGTYVALRGMPQDARDALAATLEPGDTVERVLRDGDPAAFNRQPTLHKLGTMGYHLKCNDGRRLPPPEDVAPDDGLDVRGRPPPLNFRIHISAMGPHNADADGGVCSYGYRGGSAGPRGG